jgi:hypothetical protein
VLHADVFAHVRPAQVSVVAFSRRWEICLDTADHWVGAMGWDLEDLSGVFPGSVGDDDVDALYRAGLSHPDADRRWVNAARVAVGRGSGRDWWWSLNLVRKALAGWPYINGRLLLSGVDCHRTPFPDWLDACYMMLWSGVDEKERIKLDLELSLPPAGVAVRQSKTAKLKMLSEFAAD